MGSAYKNCSQQADTVGQVASRQVLPMVDSVAVTGVMLWRCLREGLAEKPASLFILFELDLNGLPNNVIHVSSILKMEATLKKTNLHGLSPRANYTDRATADCQRSDRQLLRIEGCYVVSVTDPYGRILGFLDRSRYFSNK
jgi:hypothetical protein